MPLPRPALVAAALLVSACVRVHSTPLAAAHYAPVPADSVRLFAVNAPAKYTEIAIMNVQSIFGNDRKSASALREKAGAMGANGVLLLNPRAAVIGNSGSNIGVIVGGKHSSTVIVGDGNDAPPSDFSRAVAIRYVPDTSSAGDATRTAATP